MHRPSPDSEKGLASLRLFVSFLGLFSLSVLVLGAAPAWWSTSNPPVVNDATPNDYAAVNQGQVKNIAKAAVAEFELRLPGGAGVELHDLVDGWETPGGATNDYAAVNLGQLKALAKPFYDRLKAVGYVADYPWADSTNPANDYAMANIGQVKNLFAFDLASIDAIHDTDQNGLPDWWEKYYFGTIGSDPEGDEDGDGLSNLAEFQAKSNPKDYYSQGNAELSPVLSIVGGNYQFGLSEALLEKPLRVEVRNASGGSLLVNAPVRFSVGEDDGIFRLSENGVDAGREITIRTDAEGIASVFYRQGSALGVFSAITAQAKPTVEVTLHSATVPEDRLVGHWRFEEATGNLAADSGPFGFDAILVNPQWSQRYTGEGDLVFSGPVSEGGNDSHVLIEEPTHRAFDFNSESFTLGAWVRYDETALPGRIISKGNAGSTPGYYLAVSSDGTLEFGIGTSANSAAESVLVRTVEAFDDNEWHHVAAVVDQAGGTLRVYVNGIPAVLEKETGTGGSVDEEDEGLFSFPSLEHLNAGAPEDPASPLLFASRGGNDAFFKGALDEVRLYRKALSQEEVGELYRSESPLTAKNATLNIEEDTLGVLLLPVEGGGSTPALYSIVTPPQNGTLVLEGQTANYYPNAHYNGSDSFRFKVTKGAREAEANVTITVTPIDDPPLVSVGGGRSVLLSGTLNLTAVVTDIDTSPENIRIQWMKVSGPGEVTFGTPKENTTTATFSAAGMYLLRASAYDGTSTRSDSLVVTVQEGEEGDGPTVSLESPANDVGFDFQTPILLQASALASGTRNTIEKVEFYEGSRKIGEATAVDIGSGFYQIHWTPSRIGAYAISALAVESTGQSQFSAARTLRVTQQGWFSAGGTPAGNEGYSGSGGSGGISEGSGTGPGGGHGPGGGGGGGGNSAGGGGDGFGNPNGTDPNSIDSDGDGLSDAEEAELGTDPLIKDTDGDGYTDLVDGWPRDPDLYPPRLPNPHYLVVPLASLHSDNATCYYGQMNEHFQFVRTTEQGWYWDAADTNPPVWVPLDSIDEHKTINNRGDVTGHMLIDHFSPYPGYVDQAAATWSASSGTTMIDTVLEKPYPEGYRSTSAFAINDDGVAVVADFRDGNPKYFVWSAGGKVLLPNNFEPWAINNGGVVIGNGLWDGGVLHGVGDGFFWGISNSVDYPVAISNYLICSIWTRDLISGWSSKPLLVRDRLNRRDVLGFGSAINDRCEIAGEFGPGTSFDVIRNGERFTLGNLGDGWNVSWVYNINNQGVIFGEAIKNGSQKEEQVLLLPVELKDIKKVADLDDDVYIEDIGPKKPGESENAYIQRPLSNRQIAWIEPHGAVNGTDPEMPHLVAKLSGPAKLKARWKLEVEYKRGNGYRDYYVNDFTQFEDTVRIPANGDYTAEMNADQEWRIFETTDWIDEIAQRGFFGGTAKLYVWLPSQGVAPIEPFMTFRIGGKNPDQTKAKTFINSEAGSAFWYAYAIAKHETFGRVRENGVVRFYNQFYTDYKSSKIGDAAIDMGWAAYAKAWPLYNLDRDKYESGPKKGQRYQNGPGGYGMYQVTLGPKLPNDAIPQGGEGFITRGQIWNWQDNARRAIEELQGKASTAQSLHNGLTSTYPNSGAIPSYKHFSGLEAIVITYYNGMGGGQIRRVAVNGYRTRPRSCWAPFAGGWEFLHNRYVDTGAKTGYVHAVDKHVE